MAVEGEATTKSGAQLITDGTLTVCSDVPYPPFEDFDKGSATGFKGFDIDLLTEIAKGLDLKLVVKDSAFDPLQSGLALNSGQCDIVASAMTITADREKNLDFSDGYYDSKQSLLVPTGSDIKSIDDLAGKKVGVQQGTTGKAYTEEHAPDAEIVSFPSDAEMFQAIKAGQVDALLQDLPVNLEHQQAGGFDDRPDVLHQRGVRPGHQEGQHRAGRRRQRAAEEDARRRHVRPDLQQVLLDQVTPPSTRRSPGGVPVKRTTRRKLTNGILYAILVLAFVLLGALADWSAVKANFFDPAGWKRGGNWDDLITIGVKNTIIYTFIVVRGSDSRWRSCSR